MEPESSVPAESPHGASASDPHFLWIVLVLTAIANLSAVRFGFVYDDYGQILSNPFVRAWRYVPEYFSNSVWKHMYPVIAGNYYRPVFLLWIRINYAVFGSRPLGWHIEVVLLHLIATALVYLTVRKMTGRARVAWMTALIFGLHPIHHEVVAWVSGATESLFAIPFLAGFLAYLRSRESSRAVWMAVSCGLYGVALLCKETAIIFPALIFVHGWISETPEDSGEMLPFGKLVGRGMAAIAAYIPIAFVYLAVRHKVLSGFGHPLSIVPFSTWLFTLPSVLFFYVRNWFWPVGLAIIYDVFFQNRVNFLHVLLPAAIVMALGCALWIFRKRLGSREVGYAVAWIVLPLLPALDYVVFRPEELVHDRYFYVPSMGTALLIALVIEKFGKSRRLVFRTPIPVIVTTFILAVVLAAGTVQATSFWQDGYTLFTRAHEIAPQNSIPVNNLSEEYMDRGEIDKAQALLEPGYQQNRGNVRYAFNLGRAAYLKQQYPKAEGYIREAIAIDPNFGDSYVYLGMMHLKENHPLEAKKSLQRAVELNPYDPRFHTSYGIALEVNGDCPDALSQFDAALALNPGDGLTEREVYRCRAAAASTSSASSPVKP